MENFTAKNRQVFPSGEAREFAPGEGGVWVLTAHEVPDGIDYGADLLGTAMDAMPAPKSQGTENV